MIITFEPLNESHFPLLLKWLKMFHVKRWWDRDVNYTIDLVREKYSSYVKGYKLIDGVQKPIQGLIIHADQTPMGYIQIYNAYDFPRSKPISGLPKSLGAFDVFIGEKEYLRQSLGSKAISEFLKLHGREYSHIFADPDLSNFAAVKCYEKAGFKEIWNRDMYMPNQKLMLKEIKTPPFDAAVTEDKFASEFPPRTQDVKLIASVLKKRPIKISSGFCGMCDSNITNEWVSSPERPLYELRHLVDVGCLRENELEILIQNLEDGTLDNYWPIPPAPRASYQKPSPIPINFFKSLFERTNCHGRVITKLYNLVIKTHLVLQYLFFNFRKFFIKSRIKIAKNRWFLSKNLNYYNPTLEATVFRNGDTWRIARHGHYFGAFKLKEEAMNEIFQIWLKDKKITEIANELEHELKNIKHKILNKHKYQVFEKQLQENANEVYKDKIIKALNPKRIMIFGRPGSGKSTFATWLSQSLDLPLHHLDKHFYNANWVERDYNEFLQIQHDIVNSERWIVDGNSTRSLEMRWTKADLVIYFNFPKVICIFRILKRILRPNKSFDDRAPGCIETIRWSFLKYMWGFEERVSEDIKALKERYPHAVFKEIRCDNDLNKLRHELVGVL